MKKIKKHAAFALLAILAATSITNLHAHRGGWGWGGFGAGLFTGALVGGLASRGGGGGGGSYSGFPYWQVANNTGRPILVRGSSTKSWVLIEPGQSATVNRRKKYKLYAKFADVNDDRRRPYYQYMDGNPNVAIAAPNNQLQMSYGSSPQPAPGSYAPGPYPPNRYYPNDY